VVAVEGGHRRALHDGDVIEVGPFRLTYEARSPAAVASGEPETAALARAMVRDLLAAIEPHGEGPVLEIGTGAGSAGRRVALPAPGRSLVIGRGESCDVALDDPDLSREHVRVNREWGGVTVSDLGSKNGTKVDGVAVAVGVERGLKDGERVEIGGTVIVLRDPAEAYLRKLAEPVPEPEAEPEAEAEAEAEPVVAAVAVRAASVPEPVPVNGAGAGVGAGAGASANPARRQWGSIVVALVVVAGAIAAIVALLSA
jgi:hypothetical protein